VLIKNGVSNITNSLLLLLFNMMVSTNVRLACDANFSILNFVMTFAGQGGAVSHKLLEVFSTSLSRHWKLPIESFCMCPAVLNSFSGKLSLLP
jgi:hypothetical protein